MTSHTGRLYATALALVVFFLGWAAIAARPWASTAKADPRLQALAIRQAALQREAKLVAKIVALKKASAATPVAAATQNVSAPVKVVNLPPLTITRTS
jgi:hypothetical protein